MSKIDSLHILGADSLYNYNKAFFEKIDSIHKLLENINAENDDNIKVWLPIAISLLVAFYGLYQFILYCHDRYVEKECQKKVFLDLFRHLFTINTHAEAIRVNMRMKQLSNNILTEGTLERLCFIDYDLELNNMRLTSRSYELLHCIREKMRNFNSVCMIAERHFTDPACPDVVRTDDLNNIWNRSVELSNDIFKYTENAGISFTTDDVSDYIREYYTDTDRIPKWIKEGKLNQTVTLPDRIQEGRSYYDNYDFRLTDIMDYCIRCRIDKVKFK